MNEQQSDAQEKSSLSPLSNLIKTIWYVSMALGAAGIMLQDKFSLKQMFWSISISTLFLAVSCAVMLFTKVFEKVERALYTLATIGLMIINPHWLDIPAYLANDYKVIEGVPTEFDHRSPYKAGNYLHIEIRNVKLKLPTSVPNSVSDRWFVIQYLPYSKFIMDYEILTKQETLEMLKKE